MTTLLSWNIQAGLGVDGRIDLTRIARTVTDLADADVICLQEVERSPSRAGEGGSPHLPQDQFLALASLFPAYAFVIGASVERAAAPAPSGTGAPYLFGNIVLSRLPILSVFRHPLPQPVVAGVRHMPRQATEVTVDAPGGPLRVVTTHLEFHSQAQRLAQVSRLRELHREICALEREPGAPTESGPYARFARSASAIVCGDFNMETGSAEYTAMVAPFDDGTPSLTDAWPLVHPGRPHDPTCGIFDWKQWPMGAHCRDFFFVTDDLHARLRSFLVDTRTDASDHQPIVITFRDA